MIGATPLWNVLACSVSCFIQLQSNTNQHLPRIPVVVPYTAVLIALVCGMIVYGRRGRTTAGR